MEMVLGNDVRDLSTLADGFPYYPPTPRGVAFIDQQGACDPLMREQYQRENPFRYATLFYRWTRQGSGALRLAAQTLSIFQTGATESAAGTGGITTGSTALTRAETNAFVGGGVAKQGNRFIGVGLQIQPLAPFTVVTDATAVGAQAVRRRPNWFNGGTNYAAECLKLLADTTTLTALHGADNACSYDFGPIAMFMTMSPEKDYQPAQAVPGQFTFLAVPDLSGNKQDGYNLQINATTNEILEVDSDPLNPTVAGLDVVTPVRVALVGFPICVGQGNGAAACGIPTGDLSTIVAQQVQAQMKRFEGNFANMMEAVVQRIQNHAQSPNQLPPPGNKNGGRYGY